jgi:eukaryotic-like serine/threonine-protein kinase
MENNLEHETYKMRYFEDNFYWPSSFSPKYEKLEKLGEGANGIVHKAKRTSDGKIVAIKYLKTFDFQSRQRFQNEIQVYQKLEKSSNIIKIYDYSLTRSESYFVMEFCEFGNARNQLNYFMDNPVQAVDMLLGVTKGIKRIHDLGTYHRDIKPDNLLFTKNIIGNYVLKIGDAGMSCLLPNSNIFSNATYTLQGTASYIAPELFLGRPFTAKSDIFSFGVTCHELLTGVQPLAGQFVTRGPFEMQNVVQRMIASDPKNRLSIEQVIGEMTQALSEMKAKQEVKDFIGGLVKVGVVVGGAFLGANLLNELFKRK